MIAAPSTVITEYLGFPPGSVQSMYMKLFLCFFFSAAFHSVGGIFAARQELGEFRFFLLQAPVIAAEDRITRVAKSWGWKGGASGRAFGYFWMATWMTWSLRAWVDGRMRGGEWNGRQIPFSVVEKLWKRE